jgi:Holliday junction resolvasome RuvABC endonuclease subunit
MSGVPTSLLALDPSSRSIGYAVVGPGPSYIASGVVHPLGMDADERIRFGVWNVVVGLINHYDPAAIIIEMPDHIADTDKGRNSQNLIKFFRAVGVTESAAARFNKPILTERSSNLKMQSGKEQRRQRFQQIVGRPPATPDESDALCLAWDRLLVPTVPLASMPLPPL